MKHLPACILLAVLFGSLFSCMGESEEKTLYQRLGIVQANPVQAIETIDGYLISSPAFTGMQAGECYRIDFKASLPEIPSGNVMDVAVERIDTIPVWPFADTFTDTTTILPGELRLKSVKINKKNNYLDGRLFVYTVRDSFFVDEQTKYDLSYNWDEVKERDEQGKYVYALFLRFTQSGGKDTIRVTNTNYTNAFVFDDFLQKAAEKELAAGKDTLFMRMNYAKGFNADSSAWTWSSADFYICLPIQ